MISNILYYNLNWERLKQFKQIPEAFLIGLVSAEILLQIF